jgi:hypothetical protein
MPFKNLNLSDLTLSLYTFNETKAVLEQPLVIPDGAVKNLATSISYDQDFIILGDAYKNLTILKKANPEENQK